MRIDIDKNNYKKNLNDIYRIFKPRENLIFVSQNPDIIINDRTIIIDNKSLEFTDKKDLNRIFYSYLSKIYDYESAWGSMTGTKPQRLFDKRGASYLRENYMVSEKKLNLLQTIGQVQKRHDFFENNISLYINVPFCPTRCSYCSFPTIIYGAKDRRDEYLRHLIFEIRELSNYINKRKLRTIYIGGGTPTAFTYEQIRSLLHCLRENFKLESLEEFTIEAGREDTLDREKFELMKSFFVNRISINPQSFNGITNEKIGRKQDLNRLKSLYFEAKSMGFLVNMDLIAGLEGEGVESIRKSLAEISKLQPDNLTVHTLSVKKGSKLEESHKMLMDERGIIEDMLSEVDKFIKNNFYEPYYLYRQKEIMGNFENIGYSLKGKECIYNIIMNEEKESVIGLGMTSNSKIFTGEGIIKYRNPKNLDQYFRELSDIVESKKKILGGDHGLLKYGR